MASIYKRGSRYTVSVSVKDGGKYRKKTKSGFKTKAEAKMWASEQKNLKYQGRISFSSDMPMPDFFIKWTETYKQNPSGPTQNAINLTYGALKKDLSDITIKDLTRTSYQQFINTIAKRYARWSVVKINSYVHQAVQAALYDDVVYKDPTDGIIISGNDNDKKELNFLEEHEMKSLIKSIAEKDIDKIAPAEMMIVTALYTGARFGELAALTWADINDDIIDINKSWDRYNFGNKSTKTIYSVRTISVPHSLIELLLSWSPDHLMSEYIFKSTHDNGHPIVISTANKYLKNALKAIGATHMVTFHGLRHTHASWLISKNVDIQYVSERLGHSNTEITLRVYTHFLESKRNTEIMRSVNLLEEL